MGALRTWEADCARRLGIGGVVDFETTRIGKTLHVPCSRGPDGKGHLVDVTVRPNLDPNGTVKQMIHAGWAVGSRHLVCPDCNQKTKDGKNKGRVAFAQNLAASLTPEQRSAKGRAAAAARWNKPKGNGQMPDTIETPQPEAPVPTPAAGKAKRLIYMALEDHYDEVKKCYRAGKSDGSIAKELGISENLVKSIREESYGPLGEPEELGIIRAELAHARRQAVEKMASIDREYERIDRKFGMLCSKQGWAVA